LNPPTSESTAADDPAPVDAEQGPSRVAGPAAPEGTRFDDLAIPEAVRGGIRDAGFTRCTPIQDKVLPLSLAGRDVAGQAQTGTGKTAAFLITIFTRLLESGRPCRPGVPRALIVAPTRELVVQIAHDAAVLGGHTGLQLHAVYGGVDYRGQREVLQGGVDVLVGTPGRLIDYLKQRVYDLHSIEALVIDEADRMFDMGFIRDLRFLLRRCPPYTQRQSMLFSATLSYEVVELAYEHMNDPVRVSATPQQLTAEKVEHLVYHVGKYEKLALLVGILQREAGDRVLIFTNMRRTAERLVHALEANGLAAAAITGDVEQRRRLKLLTDFKEGRLPVLVATDVASRGLHIEGVTHVINYDLPRDADDYVHRAGRTARAGASGKAISLACEEYVDALEPIEQYVGFKLPHVIPDDGLFAHVIHPRRAPERSGAGPWRERRGAGPERNRGARDRRGVDGRGAHGHPHTAAPAPAPRHPGSVAAGGGTAASTRRRRRRRRGGGGPVPGSSSQQ
jgi:ATP-dependent RNA helicase RhlB